MIETYNPEEIRKAFAQAVKSIWAKPRPKPRKNDPFLRIYRRHEEKEARIADREYVAKITEINL